MGPPIAACVEIRDFRLLPSMADVLTAEERSKYCAYSRCTDAARFLVGRVLARSIIAQALACPQTDIAFVVASGGKPFLSGREDICFSISHSGNYVACVLWDEGAIGLDIEIAANAEETRRLAPEFCSDRECAWIHEGGERLAAQRCLTLWTLKEAYAKATGEGLDDPRTHEFALSDAVLAQRIGALPPGELQRWQFATAVKDDYTWSLACRADDGNSLALRDMCIEQVDLQVLLAQSKGAPYVF